MTAPAGDGRAAERVALFAQVEVEDDLSPAETALGRLQRGLFSPTAVAGEAGGDVVILSAPGESRECVEIARLVHRESERGVPFDKMAILLRSPLQYRAHIEEALRRASVPAYFARGTVKPDPAGRAFLALLSCAADGLSARRFAEYLSLGEVADAEDGKPPAARPVADRWVPPDEDLLPSSMTRAGDGARADVEDDEPLATSPTAPTVAGTFTRPSDVGALDRRRCGHRWKGAMGEEARRAPSRTGARLRRCPGARRRGDGRLPSARARRARSLEGVRASAARGSRVAAPPFSASWGVWLSELTALATRALRHPDTSPLGFGRTRPRWPTSARSI